LNCIERHWTVELYWTVLYCIELYWNVLKCMEQYWTALNCIELYWTVLNCIGLYLTVFSTFMIWSLNFLKRLPCIGFVNMSAAIFRVGQYTTYTSFYIIVSSIKEYFRLICLVQLLLDILPFFASSIVLILCWYIVVLSDLYPCASKKYQAHKIFDSTSFRLAISASVELHVFFCRNDVAYTAPFPKVMRPPVSSCVMCSKRGIDPPIRLEWITWFKCEW